MLKKTAKRPSEETLGRPVNTSFVDYRLKLFNDSSNSTRMCLLFSALSSIVRHHQHLYPISIMHRSALFGIIISKFVAFLLQIRYFVATYRLDQSHDSFLKIIMFFDKCSIDSLFLPSVTSAYIFIVVLISE